MRKRISIMRRQRSLCFSWWFVVFNLWVFICFPIIKPFYPQSRNAYLSLSLLTLGFIRTCTLRIRCCLMWHVVLSTLCISLLIIIRKDSPAQTCTIRTDSPAQTWAHYGWDCRRSGGWLADPLVPQHRRLVGEAHPPLGRLAAVRAAGVLACPASLLPRFSDGHARDAGPSAQDALDGGPA